MSLIEEDPIMIILYMFAGLCCCAIFVLALQLLIDILEFVGEAVIYTAVTIATVVATLGVAIYRGIAKLFRKLTGEATCVTTTNN